MTPRAKSREPQHPAWQNDPRVKAGESAEVIELGTRYVPPYVSVRKRRVGRGWAIGVLVVAAIGGVTLWSINANRGDNGPQRPAPQQRAPQPEAAVQDPAIPLSKLLSANPSTVQSDPLGPPPSAPAPSPILAKPPLLSFPSPFTPANPHASPVLVFDAGVLPGPGSSTKATGPATGKKDPVVDFAGKVGGVGTRAAFDPATTVTQGTLIPAVLETAIDTDVPGYVRAIVSTDVRSADGRHLLVPRSSRLIGQYQSGVSAGQKRAYVIWTQLTRPDGVTVNIVSPTIGLNGQTETGLKVDDHFFRQFGSATLLSTVGGQSVPGAKALANKDQTGPTIRVRQGEPVRILTARDLDFSKVS